MTLDKQDFPWYDDGMKSKYEFRVKFNAERERFVLLCQLTFSTPDRTTSSEWYECFNLTFDEPYDFFTFVPLNQIPDQFCITTNKLPDGVELAGAVVSGDSIRFGFAFTKQALLRVTPPIYRHWVNSVIEAGHFDHLFERA